MCEDKPGGAVEQGEQPAGEDDPLGPGHGADVLKIIKNKWMQSGHQIMSNVFVTRCFRLWKIAMYLLPDALDYEKY